MVVKTKDVLDKLPASKIINSLVEQAVEAQASYIHIEPNDQLVLVRFRVNGVLKDIGELPKKRFISLIERLKTLANLNVRERHVPQEGKFKLVIGDHSYNFRVSIIPTVNGEKVAISIQNDTKEIPSLEDMGLWGASLESVISTVARGHGMILVTGPTDSGKSSTIFSILGNMNSPEMNIATIEDPVEYKLARANQTQVNEKTKLTFTAGLKAILKHDTNVIMISDLRDSATTELAFEVAGQGRLVISSIYVDNAAKAVNLLKNTSVSPPVIAHSLKLLISQRLVRRLCQYCKEAYTPDRLDLIQVKEIFSINDQSKMRYLHKLEGNYVSEQKTDKPVKQTKSVATGDLSSTDSKIRRLWQPRKGGCKNCSQTGYKGRVGIFEAMSVSPTIQKLIVGHGSSKVIYDQAIKEGMIPMQIDGLVKALVGITSLDEVVRFGLENIAH